MVIIISIVGILLVILLIGQNRRAKKLSTSNVISETQEGVIKYDEETELYYIRDEATNEIIAASPYKEDLNFYKKHPDYKPDPFATRSTDLHDFLYVGEVPFEEN